MLDVIRVLNMSRLLCPMKDEASGACVGSVGRLVCIRVASMSMVEYHTVLSVLFGVVTLFYARHTV